MNRIKIPLPLPALLALAACAFVPTEETGPCPVYTTSDWRAWIDAMRGPRPRQLVVAGQIVVRTGGYRAALELGPVREIDPPVQEVLLRVTPPSGPATQAMTGIEVSGRFPALDRYGAVIVRCASEVVAEIAPIETAH